MSTPVNDTNNMPQFVNFPNRAVKIGFMMGALLCMLSVLIGAFAAHGLKAIITPYQLDIVQTGAKYQMYHGFALLISSLVMASIANTQALVKANIAFIAGSILFSGSLYMLALTQIKPFAYLTPIGGICFIVGWSILAWVFLNCVPLKKRVM
jgi:uncharacterized membrane protein YgdD (TMEM256/DUF423 family)